MDDKTFDELNAVLARLNAIWPKIDLCARRELIGTMNGVAIATESMNKSE